MKNFNHDSISDSNDENRDENACVLYEAYDYVPCISEPIDPIITVNVSETQYEIVRHVCITMGYKLQESPDAKGWDLRWVDTSVDADQLSVMQPYQKINHYPGMYSLARKNHLGMNLYKLAKAFPKEYSFFPKTWLIPAELNEFKKEYRSDAYYIAKPEAMCQGKGIFLVNSLEQLYKSEHCVVQKYITNPYLIEGLKFDLRIYALVYGIQPIRIFVYNQGLARFSTDKYEAPSPSNCKNMFMHLTNYAINKNSSKFKFNEDSADAYTGHKRCLDAIWKYIDSHGGSSIEIKQKINDIIVKTICTAEPSITHIYKSCQLNDYDNSCCFEVLGFDIILDNTLNPILLEVNHSPSFTTDTPFDRKVKNDLISDTLNILHFTPKKKRRCLEIKKLEARQKELGIPIKETAEQKQMIKQKRISRRIRYENNHLGDFNVIFPTDSAETMCIYVKYINEAKNIWEAFTGLRRPIPINFKKQESSKEVKRPFTCSNATKAKEMLKPIIFDDRIKDIQRIYKCQFSKKVVKHSLEIKKRRTITICKADSNAMRQTAFSISKK